MSQLRSKKKKMVNSFLWTDEEAKYLKAVLKWKERESLLHSDDDKRSKTPDSERLLRQQQEREAEKKIQEQQKPAGEFRVLVIGAKGTGKTSILQRFASGTFPDKGQPPDAFYERGCRHRIELDSSAYSFSLPGQGQSQALNSPGLQNTQQTQTYIVDALEMPSKHLASDPMLEQALNVTEAGVLVYDVCDPKSLQLVMGIAEFVKEYLDKVNAKYQQQTTAQGGGGAAVTIYPRRREFPLILVGNKSDVDDISPSPFNSNTTPRETETETGIELEPLERQVTWAEGSKAAAKITTIGNINNTLSNNPNGNLNSGLLLSPTTNMTINPQGPTPFVEVSAKNGSNIDVIFPRLARDILRYRWLVEQKVQREQRHQQQQLMLLRQRELGAEGYRGTGGAISSGKELGGYGYGYDSSSAGDGSHGLGLKRTGKKRFWRRVGGCFR